MCSSPWDCPICSPRIGEQRAKELDAAIRAWIEAGGSVWFVTATLRHKLGDHLGDLLQLVQDSWSATWRHKSGCRPEWYAGQARAVEITHGVNGWHPHVHAAVFVEPGQSVGAALQGYGQRWASAVRRRGGSTAVGGGGFSPGWDVRPVALDAEGGSNLGKYLAKIEGGWSAGHELARADIKSSSGGRTPWELLADAMTGDGRSAALWAVYQTATAGRRRVVVSPGLMARCGVEMATEEEAAIGAEVVAPTALVCVPGGDWKRLFRAGWAARLYEDIAELGRNGPGGWPWPPEWIEDTSRLPEIEARKQAALAELKARRATALALIRDTSSRPAGCHV